MNLSEKPLCRHIAFRRVKLLVLCRKAEVYQHSQVASLVGVCILHPWLTPNLNAPSYANYSVSPNPYPFCITVNSTTTAQSRSTLLLPNSDVWPVGCDGPSPISSQYRRLLHSPPCLWFPTQRVSRVCRCPLPVGFCRSGSLENKRFEPIKELGKGTTHQSESSQVTDLVGRNQGTEDTGKMVLQ